MSKELLAPQQDALLKLAAVSKIPLELQLNGRTRVPAWIQLQYQARGSTPQERAKDLMDSFGAIFRPTGVEAFDPSPVLLESKCCFTVSYGQKANGLDVFGAAIEITQTREGVVTAINALVAPGAAVPATAKIAESQAKNAIKGEMNAEEFSSLRGRLVVLPPVPHGLRGQRARLAWHFAFPSDAENKVKNWFVDATDGRLLAQMLTKPARPGDLPLGQLSTNIFAPVYHINPETSVPDYLSWRHIGGLPIGKPNEDPTESVYNFLEAHPDLFADGSPRKHNIVRKVVTIPDVNFKVIKTSQHYGGLPIFGVGLNFFVSPQNRLWTIAGNHIPRLSVDLTSSIPAAQAVQTAATRLATAGCSGCSTFEIQARAKLLATKLVRPIRKGIFPRILPTLPPRPPSGPVLTVMPSGGLTPVRPIRGVLAYEVLFKGAIYYVGAADNRILYSYITRTSDGGHGDRKIFDANGAAKEDFVTTFGIDASEASSSSTNTDVVSARQAAHAMLNFWYQRADLFPVVEIDDVMDNEGSEVNLLVNAVPTDENGNSRCGNAFHMSGAFFGGPDHMVFCTGYALPDIVGHEMTHGFTQHSSGLIYADESGALNESVSDIMGEIAFPDPGGTWVMGTAGVVNRNMAAQAASSMATYQYPAGNCIGNYDNPGCDNGGVHTNSGIPNRAAVLMSDGVPALPPATGTTPGMGRDKVAAMVFFTNALFLSEWSGFTDFLLGLSESCNFWRDHGWGDKFPTGLSQETCEEILNAFNRVGVSATTSMGWYHSSGLLGASEDFVRDDGVYVAGCTLRGYRLKATDLDNPGLRWVCSDASICTPAGDTLDYTGGEFWAKVNSWGPAGGARKVASIHVGRSNFEDVAVDIEFVPNVPPGLTAAHCEGDVIQRKSNPIMRHWSNYGLGGKDDEWVGPTAAMPAGCIVTGVTLEKVEANGDRIGSTGYEVGTNNSGARIKENPVGTGSRRVKVHWWFNSFNIIRYRAIYTIASPAGVACWP